MKRLFAIILTLILTVGITIPIQASSNSTLVNDIEKANNQIAKAIEIIMTHYLEPVTINQLYAAAAQGMTVKLNQTNYHEGIPTVTVGTTVPVQTSQELSISSEAQAAAKGLSKSIEQIMAEYAAYLTVNELLEATLRGMAHILDTYSIYMSQTEYNHFIGVMSGSIPGLGVAMVTQANGHQIINDVDPDSIAQQIGILPGDTLLFVNWKPVVGLYLDAIVNQIFNQENDLVNIVIQRDGHFHTFDISMADMHTSTVAVKRLEYMPVARGFNNLNEIRYMHISGIGRTTGDDVQQALYQMQREGVRRLILDLQGNTGGYLDVTVDISNLLVPAGTILQTVDNSGQRYTYSSTLQSSPFEYIVVLIDRYTASGAEVIASALQDSGAAVIIGENTYGKGLVQSIYELGTDGALKITTKEYFRRNGGTINQIGVVPCIEVGQEELNTIMYRALTILTGR